MMLLRALSLSKSLAVLVVVMFFITAIAPRSVLAADYCCNAMRYVTFAVIDSVLLASRLIFTTGIRSDWSNAAKNFKEVNETLEKSIEERIGLLMELYGGWSEAVAKTREARLLMQIESDAHKLTAINELVLQQGHAGAATNQAVGAVTAQDSARYQYYLQYLVPIQAIGEAPVTKMPTSTTVDEEQDDDAD